MVILVGGEETEVGAEACPVEDSRAIVVEVAEEAVAVEEDSLVVGRRSWRSRRSVGRSRARARWSNMLCARESGLHQTILPEERADMQLL